MTTARQIVTDAMGEAGIVAVDGEPEASELEVGLRRLNALIKSLFGAELGDQFETVSYGDSGLVNTFAQDQDASSDIDSIYIPTNVRLVLNNAVAKTLYLHPNPRDGARIALIDNGGNLATYNVVLNGNGRKIELGTSVTLNTNSLNREWFYRADLANWVRVSDLTPDDAVPFPEDFDDFLTTALAIRLNPRYGAQTSQETAQVLARMRSLFRARYRQVKEESAEEGIVRLSSRRKNLFTDMTTDSFDRGR